MCTLATIGFGVAIFHVPDTFNKLTPAGFAGVSGIFAWRLLLRWRRQPSVFSSASATTAAHAASAEGRKREPFGDDVPDVSVTLKQLGPLEQLAETIAAEHAETDPAVFAYHANRAWGRHDERRMCREMRIRIQGEPLRMSDVARIQEYDCPVDWYPQEDWEVLYRHLRAKSRYKGRHFNPTHLRSTPLPRSYAELPGWKQVELQGYFDKIQEELAAEVEKKRKDKENADRRKRNDAKWQQIRTAAM